METKNLKNLVIKHFGFLEREYGFTYNDAFHGYVKNDLELEVEHKNGELMVLVTSKEKRKSLLSVLGEHLKEKLSYPEHFSSLILSMGDVDSRLAYDAKLLKQYATDIL